jgi:V8-like Glu-specific endopeptidase
MDFCEVGGWLIERHTASLTTPERESHSLGIVRNKHRAKVRLLVATIVAVCANLVTSAPTNAVVGGTSALGNTAVVRILNGSSSCSGALWTSRIVVTAGHCVVNSSGTVTTGVVSVFAPGVSTQQSPQTVSQSQIIVVDGFRKYSDFSQPDDIAFIVLSSELTGGTITRLATVDEVSAWSRDARTVTFLGYGRTSPGGPSSPVPNQINQPLTPFTPWPGSFTASQTASTGICSGDSGGPVITQVGNEVVLIGINSAASGPCSPSSRPSMTGFVPSAFPALVKLALDATNSVALPLVTTSSAVGVRTTSAVLTGTVIASNLLTTASFTYGLQPDLSGATTTIEAAKVSGNAPTAFEAAANDLMPGTTYYFRANATNLAGTVSGAIASFTTLGGLPIVTSSSATSIASDSVIVTGTFGANSASTQAFFQLSTVPDFSSLAGSIVAGDIIGDEIATLSASFSGLTPGATYFWRAAATNAAGTAVGTALTFATPIFQRKTSLSSSALLTALAVDRTDVRKIVIAPLAKSRQQCTLNTRTNRLTMAKPGICRLKVTLTKPSSSVVAFFNLAIR